MEVKEILEKMRKEDRLLKESDVTKAVQKALIEMGYEPFENKVMGVYTAIENTETAYDVENVISEMKKEQKDEVNAGICPSGTIHCLTAIDIVRKGGVSTLTEKKQESTDEDVEV